MEWHDAGEIHRRGSCPAREQAIERERIHPTQKPINLYRWLIQKYATEGDKILDTHVGSASSLIAFEEAGLEYVACEKDKEIYQSAMARLEEYKSQIKLF